MKTPISKIHTSLENAPSNYNEEERFKRAQKAYIENGDICILHDQFMKLSNINKIMLEAIAQHLYGKRK
jgi:hypothetical protein